MLDYYYKIYGKSDLKTFQDLFNISANLLTYSNLTSSPFSYPLNHKHNFYAYFTFKQHMFASDFAGEKIPIKVLINYYKNDFNFDIEEYFTEKGVPLTLILEFHMVFLAFRKLLDTNSVYCMALNSDKPFYGDFRAFVYSILGQPNGDIILFLFKEIISVNDLTETVIKKIIPIDIKFKADPEVKLALFRGFVSITPSLDQEQYFKRFLADLKGTKTQKFNKTLISRQERLLCETWAYDIEKIIKSNGTCFEKQVAFDGLYHSYLLNENLKNIIPSKILIAVEDLEFSLYYKTHFKVINLLIEKNYHKIDERLFNGQEVDKSYIEDLLHGILEDLKLFDPLLAKKMLENYLSAKKLFILNDVSI